MTRLHLEKAMFQIIYGKIQTTQSTFTIHLCWLKKLIGENYKNCLRSLSSLRCHVEKSLRTTNETIFPAHINLLIGSACQNALCSADDATKVETAAVRRLSIKGTLYIQKLQPQLNSDKASHPLYLLMCKFCFIFIPSYYLTNLTPNNFDPKVCNSYCFLFS